MVWVHEGVGVSACIGFSVYFGVHECRLVGCRRDSHEKHTLTYTHSHLLAHSLTPASFVVWIVSLQYTTLAPLLLPVLFRQVAQQQSSERHHSYHSGEFGNIVRVIV